MGILLEIVCAFLVASGFVLTIVIFQSDHWEGSDTGTVFTQASLKNGGIWQKCINDANSGSSTCITYDSFFLGLPTHLQAARGFTITSLVLGLLSMCLLLFSITKCPCSSSEVSARDRLRLFGGALSIVNGCSLAAGVTWFAVAIMQQYYTTSIVSPDSERLAFGQAIFIGWSGSAACLLGGFVGVCISCGNSEASSTEYSRHSYYKPGAPAQEYV